MQKLFGFALQNIRTLYFILLYINPISGTSTYYHNAFWSSFAHAVYDRLLDLGLEEFGVVGSFNYKVIRQSERPTILVEQAFMTHAEDEEKLFSASFRQKMAQAILEGIKKFVTLTTY